jgi:hypothetical protein
VWSGAVAELDAVELDSDALVAAELPPQPLAMIAASTAAAAAADDVARFLMPESLA